MSQNLSTSSDETLTSLPDDFLDVLATELDEPNITGIALGGSFARGAATAYSDVDLAPFYRDGATLPPKRLFWRDGWLVSISPKTVAGWRDQFTRPEWAIYLVPSAACLHILLDKDGELAALVADAKAFHWEPLQPAANAFASETLMLLAEHALKLLSAVARNNMSVAPSPLSELIATLPWIVATQRGFLIESSAAYYRELPASIGAESNWSRCLTIAAGTQNESLAGRAAAALQLYVETTRLITDVLQPDHREAIAGVLERIAQIGGP